jgi:osmotically-inducible protein OsmY
MDILSRRRLVAGIALMPLALGLSYAAEQTQPMSRMETEIRHQLVMLPYYGVFDNLQFQVSGDKVTLMGQVARPSLKKSAERVVKNVEGVSSVENKIEVLPTSGNDDSIRLATYRAIYSQPALQRYQLRAVPPIHIIVNNGNVTLEGVVANESDKNIAGIQAKGVSGVFSVTNNLRVENEKE